MDITPSRREQLLRLLADGACHSGERLAEQLRITRAAVWKGVNSLRELGVDVVSLHQGYQLPHAVDMYDADALQAEMQGDNVRVQCLFTVDSTNRHVYAQSIEPTQPVLCVAEIQQAGRGRRGRSWLAPFGSGVCMSLGYAFEAVPPGISALSLVVGVAITRVLRAYGAHEVGLKWPNDIWWRGRKLAGVLIEMRGEPDGAAQVVIGLGLNTRLPEETKQSLAAEQYPVCDVYDVLGEQAPRRAQLVAAITHELLLCIGEFERQGFAPFHDEWRHYDVLNGVEVAVLNGQQRIEGVAQGASEDGSLLLHTALGVQRFVSGEVSLRPRAT
jgi:BirA family transcriptional regulator, biotin operon repressor / biotin---[acetyl-CoA-carboxylase] ligase